MRALIAATCLVVSLAGCALVPPAPGTPTPTQIVSLIGQVNAIPAQPIEVLAGGVYASNVACTDYFNRLTNQASGLNLASQEASVIGGAATGIGGAFKASPGALATMGIVFPAISISLQNSARAATGGALPAAVWPMIERSQAAYLGALVPPGDNMTALMDVSAYAALCQPVNINSLVLQAQVNATPSASGSGLVPAALTPAPFHGPPVITVKPSS